MCFTSNEHSDSLSESCFKLLVQLIDTDSIDEIMNRLIIFFASENHSNIKSYKDIIICWASSHWELVSDVLFCY